MQRVSHSQSLNANFLEPSFYDFGHGFHCSSGEFGNFTKVISKGVEYHSESLNIRILLGTGPGKIGSEWSLRISYIPFDKIFFSTETGWQAVSGL